MVQLDPMHKLFNRTKKRLLVCFLISKSKSVQLIVQAVPYSGVLLHFNQTKEILSSYFIYILHFTCNAIQKQPRILFIFYLQIQLFIFQQQYAYNKMKNTDEVSQEQLNQQINDKLNELWTGMNDKRKKMVRNMTPSYSRRTDQSQLNQSSNNFVTENQLLKMRDKLASEVSAGKHRQVQIQNLKRTIAQLTNDKKMLVYELQQVYGIQNQNINTNLNVNSSLLNESSIHNSKLDLNKNTANFQSLRKRNKNKNFNTIEEEYNDKTKCNQNSYNQQQNQTKTGLVQNLQDLSKARLIQLLRSTAQYRQFIYYYDSHQLSYLKRLQEQHKKNCDHLSSVRQKSLWAPTEILQEFRRLNKKQKWGLTQIQTQSMISHMKAYYERNYQQKVKKAKQQCQNKLKKQQREAQYGIPYDLVQICKAKQRQLSNLAKRNKSNSFIKG